MLTPSEICRLEQRELIALYDNGILVQPVYCENCVHYSHNICHKHFLARENKDYCSKGECDEDG
jgi:hypothetical protein